MEEQVLSIKDIGNILKKRLSMIIVITLVTTIGAIGLTYFVIEPTYTTTAEVLIGKKNSDEQGTEYSNNDVQMYQKLMGTYAKVVKSKDVSELLATYRSGSFLVNIPNGTSLPKLIR